VAWWIFLGKVTSPIDYGITAFINESGPKPVVEKRDPKGPTVLTPRLKFEAPMSAVSHLRRLKQVAPLKPHQIPKDVQEEPKKVPVVKHPKSEEKSKGKSSAEDTSVVGLKKEEPVAENTDEEKVKEQPEKEKKGGKGIKKRRG
jgi:hypothetical protein